MSETSSDISIPSGDVSLRVLGKSGNFQITNNGKYILFTLDRLQEVDAVGKRVQVVNPNVFKTALNWGPVTQNVVIPGSTVAATMVQLDASFALGNGKGKPSDSSTTLPKVTFALSVYIAKASGTYTFADETFPVNTNDVKYTVSVSNWPFVNSANTLQFGLAMKTNNTDSTGTNEVKIKAEAKSASVAVGGAVIHSPLLAIIDDTVTNKVLTSTYGNGSGIQFSFPSFTKSLVYDPTIDTSGTTNTTTYTNATADSNGSTVVGGNTALVTPDTTYASPTANQFLGIPYLWWVAVLVIIIVALVIVYMRKQRVHNENFSSVTNI